MNDPTEKSCKILDTLQESQWTFSVQDSCYLLRIVQETWSFLQERGHIQCDSKYLTRTCKILIFPERFDKNLARKLSCNFFLQDSYKISYILQEKLYFKYIQDLQDLMQDLASLSRKIFARLAYFLWDRFSGWYSITKLCSCLLGYFKNSKNHNKLIF